MQVFQRKRYRFIYPAGLISLVLLPFLGIYYLNRKEELQQKYVMELNFWHPELKSYFPDPRFKRKYKTIQINGNQVVDIQKLKQAQFEIKSLLSSHDTINGIHIIFGPKAKYSSMVEGFNICLKENVRYWAGYKNNIWIFHKEPRKSVNLPDELNWVYLLQNDIVVEKHKTTSIELILREWSYSKMQLKSAKSFWPAGILYLIMVGLTAQKVRKQLRKPHINLR